jgi:HEPN domain-containing protein
MSAPDPPELWQEVLAWLRKANTDHRAAEACLELVPPLRDAAAFHCQQAAEKLLKGFLVLGSTDFSKTHNLKYLGGIVIRLFPSVESLVAPMANWTHWNIAYRYPDEPGPEPEPSVGELRNSLSLIKQLEDALRTLAPPTEHHGSTVPV